MIIDLASGTGELFDLATDPTEEKNIADQPQHKPEFLRRTDELRQWKARTNQVVAASKQRVVEKRRTEGLLIRYEVTDAAPESARGVYDEFIEHSDGGVFGSNWGCRPCFTQQSGGGFMMLVCDAGMGRSWMLAKRFAAFDAVYYTAPVSEVAVAQVAEESPKNAVSDERSRCKGLPTEGWRAQRFAYFRFGALDPESQRELQSLGARQSKMGAHMAGVVDRSLGGGKMALNASLLPLPVSTGVGAKFSLVYSLANPDLAGATDRPATLAVRRQRSGGQ